MSLRWRLTLWQVGLLAAVLMGFALVSYRFLANGLAAETDRTLLDLCLKLPPPARAPPRLAAIVLCDRRPGNSKPIALPCGT